MTVEEHSLLVALGLRDSIILLYDQQRALQLDNIYDWRVAGHIKKGRSA